MQQLILHLRKDIMTYPDHWASTNFTLVKGPSFSVGFISHSQAQKCLANIWAVTATSCSPDPIIMFAILWPLSYYYMSLITFNKQADF